MGRTIAPHRMALFIAAAFLVAACNLPFQLPPATRTPAAAATPESHWRAIADGLHWRKLLPNGDELAQIIVVRIDPSHFKFRAIYSEGQAHSLADWRAREADASLIVNANFYDADRRVLGLLVSDGRAHGRAYRDIGGTFLIQNSAPAVLANRSQALPAIGRIKQAAQGFPLLVEAGQQAYFASANGERTRRTLIGADLQGRILIMVAPFLGLSLADLSAYLPTTDLEIETAFNLDGGGSTMIALPGAGYIQPSLDPAPAILAVYPRAAG